MAQEAELKDTEIDSCLEEIAQARERLGRAIEHLQDRGSLNPLDWRGLVGRYPARCVLGAVVLGFYLSRPGRDSGNGRPGTLLDDFTRAGFDSLLPVLIRFLV